MKRKRSNPRPACTYRAARGLRRISGARGAWRTFAPMAPPKYFPHPLVRFNARRIVVVEPVW